MDILSLLEFKNWADEKYIDYVESLTEEQFIEKVPAVNKSVNEILWHIYEVYWSWYHLITDRDFSNEPDLDKMSRLDIVNGIKEYNQKAIEYAKKRDLQKLITQKWDEDHKTVETNPENILFNYVTHSAYHRGQLALLLRYHGFESIDETDFNPYIYMKGQQ